MDRTEQLRRNVALELLISPEANRESILDMVKNAATYAGSLDDRGWNKIMKAWVELSKMRNDSPYPNELEEGEILINEMEMSGKGCTIKAFQMKDGKWVVKDDKKNNWHGMTWMAYNVFVDGHPNTSNSHSLQEAIWKSVTDFCMWWCEEKGYNIELYKIYSL